MDFNPEYERARERERVEGKRTMKTRRVISGRIVCSRRKISYDSVGRIGR